MTLKILIDVNLTPEWVSVLQSAGWHAEHGASIGNTSDPDTQIMAWALSNGFAVFTHDLDFGTTLALTNAKVRA